MKVFLLYLFLCFLGGIVVWRMDRRIRNAFLILVCLGVAFAYFILHKI